MERPARFIDDGRARSTHGERVDRFAPYLLRTDPLADAVAAIDDVGSQIDDALSRGVARVPDVHPAVAALFREVERVPVWVDFGAIDRAGELLFRAGAFGGLVLGLQSLPYGYASPGGNKPLALSGRLVEQAPRRLAETSRFVHAVCMPGGMRRGASGLAECVRVRVMHARIRRALWASGKWNRDAWGEPINQHDMVATNLLFSIVVLDGLRKLGFHVSAVEAQRYVQLWRYVGYVLGTDPDVAFATEAEGLKLADLIMKTQGPPDDDSRALTKALFDSGRGRVRVAYAISRYLLGAELADALAIPSTRLANAMPAVRLVVRAFDGVRARVHLLDAAAVQLGSRYWEQVALQP